MLTSSGDCHLVSSERFSLALTRTTCGLMQGYSIKSKVDKDFNLHLKSLSTKHPFVKHWHIRLNKVTIKKAFRVCQPIWKTARDL